MRRTDEPTWQPAREVERLKLAGQDAASHREFWDEAARVDSRRAISDQDTDESFEVSGRTEADLLAPLLGPDTRLLEIGCGIGRVLQHVAARCGEVHGLDVSAEMIEQARARLAHLPNVHLHVGNGYDLGDFADDSLDVVFCSLVLQHMPKTTAYNYLAEARRVLRPDGVLRIQVPNLLQEEQFWAFHHFTLPYYLDHPYPMHFYTPSEIVTMAVHAGFLVEEMTDEIRLQARRSDQPGVAAEIQITEWRPRPADPPPARWWPAWGRRPAGRVRGRR